ncbi:MAG TPA: site-2 protease family protein [Polyangia bacterium]|jgi:membrane-associated protease RseP (regulator of RpoE activity)
MNEPSPLPVEPQEPAARRPRYWLHLGLLLATVVTTTLAGLMQFGSLRGALAYSLPLMAILIAHEMGHFVAAKLHGVPASLPYFIPLPLPPGTLGAIINMRDGGTSSRRKLLDIGAAGPLAGLLVAIPVLLYGIHTSQVISITDVAPASQLTEGNSLLYAAAKFWLKGRWLPGGGLDIAMNATCQAGWFGLFVTMLNLLPIGQLDGGHVVAACIGGERHERWSAQLHRLLPVFGLFVALYVAIMARRHGGGPASIYFGIYTGAPWAVWWVLLFVLRRLSRGRYHPPIDDEPIGAGRRAFAVVVGLVYLLIFMPYVWRLGPL